MSGANRPKPIKDFDPHQPEIDFDRVTKRRKLEELAKKLPKPPAGSRTSKAAMLMVLKVIESHCGATPYWTLEMPDLAKECGIGTSAAQRAVRQLKTISLLIVRENKKGSGWRAHTFQICWSNIRDLTSEVPSETSVENQSITGSESSPPISHGDTTDRSPCDHRSVTVTPPIGHGDRSSITVNSYRQELPQILTDKTAVGAGNIFFGDEETSEENFFGLLDRIASELRVPLNAAMSTAGVSAEDIDLICKVARLRSDHRISEADLEIPLEAVRKKSKLGNPVAYFYRCIQNQFDPGEFNKLLASLPSSGRTPRCHS